MKKRIIAIALVLLLPTMLGAKDPAQDDWQDCWDQGMNFCFASFPSAPIEGGGGNGCMGVGQCYLQWCAHDCG